MTECKHGLKSGCSYCHATTTGTRVRQAAERQTRTAGSKTKTRGTALSEKMNDRMTALRRRLREIRGE